MRWHASVVEHQLKSHHCSLKFTYPRLVVFLSYCAALRQTFAFGKAISRRNSAVRVGYKNILVHRHVVPRKRPNTASEPDGTYVPPLNLIVRWLVGSTPQ